MNTFQKLSRGIIKFSFELSIRVIERYSNMEPYHAKVVALSKMEEGTLGKSVANCLKQHKITLVPKYESHDLKHVLLDYKMTPEGEIRMQAFMIGNGNVTIPSLAILTFGALLLPDRWSVLYADYRRGRYALPIADWALENYADFELTALRAKVFNTSHQIKPRNNMKRITKTGAITAIVAGVFGMIYCLPYLFSSNIADLIGAGFPFLAGAILAIGGLLTLSNLSRPILVQKLN